MAAQHVTVVARLGLTVPIEGNPRKHITSAEPRTVRLTHYYRRQIADGDLVVVPETPAKATPAKPAPTSSTSTTKD